MTKLSWLYQTTLCVVGVTALVNRAAANPSDPDTAIGASQPTNARPAIPKRDAASGAEAPTTASSVAQAPPETAASDSDVKPEVPPVGHPAPTNSMGVLTDSIEPSALLPPATVEVTALDTQSAPVAGVQIELRRDRQSVAEGNTSSKWQATTDASGHARFANVPTGSDSQFRVVSNNNGIRYGTRAFPVDSRTGTKVLFHVYPVVKNLRETLIAGRTFVFVEPRDDVLSIEVMHQFHNVGQTVFSADGLSLTLPTNWKAFSTSPTDSDLSVVKSTDGVSLTGAVAPGQHSVAYTFQIPTSNRQRVDLSLNLWPNTAEAQVATLARPGLELEVEGFANASVVQGNAGQPLLVTGQSFSRDKGPPESIQLGIAGLPVVGPGRWVAVACAALLALGSLLLAWRRRQQPVQDNDPSAASARILEELTALERARRLEQVGAETYADTKEILLSAFVRIERLRTNT